MNYIFDNPSKFLVGANSLEHLSFELRLSNVKKPLIVCDDTSYRLGLLDKVKKVFDKDEEVDVSTVFREVLDAARVEYVEKIVKTYKANDCDGMIVLGRKGVIESAKCAKILLYEDVSYLSHYKDCSVGKYYIRSFPLYVIPTNFGCGFEAANYVRVYNFKDNSIYEFDTNYASTNAVFMDPEMTDALPQKAIVSSVLCALAMSIECYASNAIPTLMSMSYANTALELIQENYEKCILNNTNPVYRTNIMNAVVMAGAAFDMLPHGQLSVMADTISDRYKANLKNVFAILFPYYLKLQKKNDLFGYALHCLISADEYGMYQKNVRVQKTLDTIDAMYSKIAEYVDYNDKLSKFNIPEEDLESIADQVSNVNCDCIEMTKEDILKILKEAY